MKRNYKEINEILKKLSDEEIDTLLEMSEYWYSECKYTKEEFETRIKEIGITEEELDMWVIEMLDTYDVEFYI